MLCGNTTLQPRASPQQDSAPSSPVKGFSGILLSHETLDDPIAPMAGDRKDARDKVYIGLRASQKCFSVQVLVTLLIHSGLHVLGCCKEHV